MIIKMIENDLRWPPYPILPSTWTQNMTWEYAISGHTFNAWRFFKSHSSQKPLCQSDWILYEWSFGGLLQKDCFIPDGKTRWKPQPFHVKLHVHQGSLSTYIVILLTFCDHMTRLIAQKSISNVLNDYRRKGYNFDID